MAKDNKLCVKWKGSGNSLNIWTDKKYVVI